MTANRARAKAIGYLMHFANGQLFAFVHYAVFLAIGHVGWRLPDAQLRAGPSTPVVNVLAHVAFGALVGGFTSLSPHG